MRNHRISNSEKGGTTTTGAVLALEDEIPLVQQGDEPNPQTKPK